MKSGNYVGLMGMVAASAILQGCNTFSFAPPKVEVDKVITAQSPTRCGGFASSGEVAIGKNVVGALELTNNFLRAYRCAAHEAADGRQIFEVPSFLALVAGAVGPTFGLGNDGRIGVLSAASVYGAANSYYAPKEKAAVLDSALDGILCVKTEAVGIGFFDTRAKGPDPAVQEAADNARVAAESAEAALASARIDTQDAQTDFGTVAARLKSPEVTANDDDGQIRSALAREADRLTVEIGNLQFRERTLSAQAITLRNQSTRLAMLAASSTQEPIVITRDITGGVIKIDVERQYYEMVAASLFSIERILSQRFSNIGSFDADGVAAELKELTAEEEKAETAAEGAADAPIDGTPAAAGATKTFASEAKRNDAVVELTLASLQPRLQQCVVRAKI